MDSERKTIEGRLKFVTRKPHLVLQGLAKLVTPYALKVVEKEMCRKEVKSYSIFQSGDVFRVTSCLGENVTSANLHTCSCSFFMSYGLPCSHIIYLATETKVSLPETAYNSCWNVENSENVKCCRTVESNESTVVPMKRFKSKVVSRENLFLEANALTRSWSNALQDLPIPAFEGQIQAMKRLIYCAKTNTSINFNESTLNTSTDIEFLPKSGEDNNGNKEQVTISEDHLVDVPEIIEKETVSEATLSEDHLLDVTKISEKETVSEATLLEDSLAEMSEISEKETVSQDVSVANVTLSKGEIRLKKLKGLHLTNVKRRMGKPRTTKRLDRYKYSPKQFLKKGNHEKVTMFLSWVTGNERAHYLLDSKEKADIKDFRSTDLMSPALFENDVTSVLKSFEYLFTTEAWDQLVKHINEQRKVDVDYVCSTCQQGVLKNLKLKNGTRKEEPWIFCDSCQIWYHYCCENLKRKPNCQKFACKSCRKHKL